MKSVGAVLLARSLLTAACARHDTGDEAVVGPGAERLVLVVVDTLRRDHVGVQGAPQSTPHIDALAARGGREQLYHLDSDPGEALDLSAEHPEVSEALRARR